MSEVAADKVGGYSFGTFKGVFTPSILTILGVIMYLRFGWVIGNVGIVQTLLIVVIASSITFLTGLSISSLATNMNVKSGGTYFIISRSLGLEAGAAVCIPLYLAQSLGIAFYVSGFAESIVALLPFLSVKFVGVITLGILAFLSFVSADLALRTQFVILALVALSLISFFFGKPVSSEMIAANNVVIPCLPFWTVFAVFFPAVTGIEAGLGLSGDLKQPSRSLPLGILSAVTVSFLIYMAIPVFLNYFVPDRALLRANLFIMKDIAKFTPLIILGVWGATLSSALGVLLGSPRTLQALARDKIVPEFFGKGYGKEQNPRVAIIVSFSVALLGVIYGDLNLIAPVLTMFFLTAYGLMNLSAALEGLLSSPSYRPKFRVPWGLSLAGACGAFAVMFMINPGATFIAIFVSSVIYFAMKRRSINTTWSDMRYGILMLALYFIIHKLEDRKPDERTWRPNMLVNYKIKR